MHSFTSAALAVFKDFADALRLGNSTNWRSPEKACTLFEDLGIKAEAYKYVGLNTYACPAPSTSLPRGSVNTVTYRPEGGQRDVKELILVLPVNDSDSAMSSHEAFVALSRELTLRSLGLELPNMLLLSLLTGRSYAWSIGQNTVEVAPIRSQGQSYEVRFVIR